MSTANGPHGSSRFGPFGQQKISAWQPVLAPRWMVIGLVAFGAIFVIIGGVLVHVSLSVVECSVSYDDPENQGCIDNGCPLSIQISASDCAGPLSVDANGNSYLTPPLYMYYHLTNFYQNHRSYVMSRNNEQLAGNIILDLDQLSSCEPALIASDGYRILVPCGLIARSVFNDTYDVMYNGTNLTLHQDVADIIWPADYADMFHNPPEDSGAAIKKLDQWLNDSIFPGQMENPHFMSWMRNAALPDFRKLYARIDDNLTLPFTVTVMNRYPVKSFGGQKSVIVGTSSWLGGRSPFLGASYCTIGALLFIIGLIFAVKNKKNPRILGDVRFLHWGKPKGQ